ncbi:transcriptional regulator ovo-like [Trichogramma pretiosum]|uniref:transcriptional regulator ovo-like n=1 Tax=Trichogramma pretiosum TaxID=7493 RepID=UPI000C7197FD|nr:transcriptional regulator ovo-like [Trichogramma pretiosum]
MTRRGKSSLPSGAQYLSQDPVSGAYQYGYSGPHHAKSESSYNGITRGGYSYVDANGLLQTVSYTADAENGFRVRASNLPSSQLLEQRQQHQPALRDAPEVALTKRRHMEQLHYAETRRAGSAWKAAYELEQQPSRRAYEQSPQKQTFGRRRSASAAAFVARPPTSVSRPEARRISSPSQQQYHHHQQQQQQQQQHQQQHYFYSSPTHVVAMAPSHMFHHGHRYVLSSAAASEMPAYVPLPMPVIHGAASHTQDALGQYEYSYTGDTSAKIESRSMDGSTRGAYSYIDANGLLQQVRYVADKDGFRVLATNLPRA